MYLICIVQHFKSNFINFVKSIYPPTISSHYHPLVLGQEQEPESPDHAAAGQHRRRGQRGRGQVPQRLLQPRGRGRGCRGVGGGGAAGGAAGRPAGGAGAAAGRGAAAARAAGAGTPAGHTHIYRFIIQSISMLHGTSLVFIRNYFGFGIQKMRPYLYVLF